jgi:hypothetical protein
MARLKSPGLHLNFARPTVLLGAYGNGGGTEHGGKVGMGVEF